MDEPLRVLRRAFVVGVVLLFLVGLPLGTATTVIGIVLAVLALGVELLVPRDRLLAGRTVLVDGRAARSDPAYAAVYQALREREVPAEVRPRRVRQPGGVRNGLLVRSGAHRIHVSVFPFGNDLALGWSMWHRRLPAQGVLQWLAAAAGGHPDPVEVEPVRALAEAVRAAVGNGVQAAEDERDLSLAEAFGYDVPIEDRTAPAPAPPPTPPTPPAPRRQPAHAAPPGWHRSGSPMGPPGGDLEGPLAGPPGGPPEGSPEGPGGPAGGPPAGPLLAGPADGLPSLVPGMDDDAERTTQLAPLQFAPFEFTVAVPVEVYTPDGAVVGRLEPGARYWAVDEHPAGLVVQIATGAALLRDRSTLHRQ